MAVSGKKGKASRRIRLEDLARICGVSIATASRALSGGSGVRPEIARLVHQAALEHGYVAPSSLAAQRVMVLTSSAAMIDYSRNQFTLNVMLGMEERAAAHRAQLIVRGVASLEEEARALLEAEADPETAGVLALTLDGEEMLAPTRRFSKPVVLVNADDPLMKLSSVAPSNRAAGALATRHLIGLGHSRILFLMRPGRATIRRRLEGWRDQMAEAGHEAPDSAVLEAADWLPELAAEAVRARLSRNGLDFTAILAAGDVLAMGAIQALAAQGIRVPEQVSVLGMDGLPQGAFQNPPLSAMQIPMREIGAAALDLLRELRNGPKGPARRIELACSLVERGSCAPAPRLKR